MERKKKNNKRKDPLLLAYLKEISKYHLLDADQEIEYSKRVMEGDQEALQNLVTSNLRLVIKIAKPFANVEIGLMDLIQEGNIGLMKAAERYDYRKEVRFSTYASWWIKQSITRAMNNKRRAVRLPHLKEESLRRFQNLAEEFMKDHSRKPTMEELQSAMSMSREEVLSILGMGKIPVSLDSEMNSETGGTLLDVLEDYSYSPDTELFKESLKNETQEFFGRLRKREKKILNYRYPVDGGRRRTLKNIGEKMGVSPETVRQIEMRALKKLRTHAEPIREYLYN